MTSLGAPGSVRAAAIWILAVGFAVMIVVFAVKAKLASLLFPALRVAVVDRAVDSCRQARDVSHLRFAEAFEMKYGLRACRRAMGRNASAASSHGVAAGIGHLGHLRIKVGGVAFLPWCSNPSFPVVHREVTESPCLVVFSLVDPRVKADLHFRASFAWDSDSSIDEARGATLPSPRVGEVCWALLPSKHARRAIGLRSEGHLRLLRPDSFVVNPELILLAIARVDCPAAP